MQDHPDGTLLQVQDLFQIP